MIIAIAEEAPEYYKNIKALLDLINTNNVRLIILCDLKVENLLCGIQLNLSKHLCFWHDIDSENLSAKGVSRAIRSLKENHNKFVEARLKISKPEEFSNQVDSLVIAEDSELVLDSIPTMALYLLLGVVHRLFKNLLQCWPTKLNIQMQAFYGGQFAGNECNRLLQNVNILQRIVEKSCTFQV